MKISIQVKLVVSYLLVIGLAVVPAYVYLRTAVRDGVADVLRGDLETQLAGLVAIVAQTPDTELPARVALLRAVLPQRVTVVAPSGIVIADTLLAPGLAENHLDRPEIADALEGRVGADMRVSRSTHEPTLYLARRFPAEGALRGVVRVSVSTKALDDVRRRGARVLNNWAALAASVALLLSLVAAILLSRPLRRLAEAATAFSHGDFGAPLEEPTNDEIGMLAEALAGLAAQLRTKLVAAGADRAAVHGLLDDLPSGVVLFDPDGAPQVVGAAARTVLELGAEREGEQLRALRELPDQAALVAKAMDGGMAVEGTLALPWRPERRLDIRWVPLFAADARRVVALVARPPDLGRAFLERSGPVVADAAALLRRLARTQSDAATAVDALKLALRLDSLHEPGVPTPSSVTGVSLAELVKRLLDELRPLSRAAEVRLELELPEKDVVLAESGQRVEVALRALLGAAIERSPRGALAVVHAEVTPDGVRIDVRTPYEPSGLERTARLVRPLGGDGGLRRDGDAFEAWLVLARA